jgi:hypothetical protein
MLSVSIGERDVVGVGERSEARVGDGIPYREFDSSSSPGGTS